MELIPNVPPITALLGAVMKAYLKLPESREKEELLEAIDACMSPIAVVYWDAQDVLNQRPDMTLRQAEETLCLMADTYPGYEELTDFLMNCAEQIKPTPPL